MIFNELRRVFLFLFFSHQGIEDFQTSKSTQEGCTKTKELQTMHSYDAVFVTSGTSS